MRILRYKIHGTSLVNFNEIFIFISLVSYVYFPYSNPIDLCFLFHQLAELVRLIQTQPSHNSLQMIFVIYSFELNWTIEETLARVEIVITEVERKVGRS